MAEMDLREEVRVAWGTGIAGYVAESGEPVNIPDAYQVRNFWASEASQNIRSHLVAFESQELHENSMSSSPNQFEIEFPIKFIIDLVHERKPILIQG